MSASVFEKYSSEGSQSWVLSTLIFVEPYQVNLLVGTEKIVSIPEISGSLFQLLSAEFLQWLAVSISS